ncbi:MAG TPA: shikimate dehydrogenase [Bacteroidales bacterium]|nr:shikimate dehydrogenase [Bacteroidales bacterium]
MRTFGLIGYPLSHSFSQGYFTKKFSNENIADAEYKNFPIEKIAQFPELIQANPGLCGLNVTIPYKREIIPFLDGLDKTARQVNAVNTIKFVRDDNDKLKLIGYNTDIYGFELTINPHLTRAHKKVLILGTGGASNAVEYVLRKLGLQCFYVSRKMGERIFKSYDQLTNEDLEDFQVIINTSPVGMYPKVDDCPLIPYEGITASHVMYDLIYNPEATLFLKKGREHGAQTINGLEMLHLQAEKAWKIWNS